MNSSNPYERISQELSIKAIQVQSVIQLLQEGATVPFIARYRKEQTGSLDEVQIRNIQSRYEYLEQVEKRRSSILKALAELDNPYGTPSQWVIDLRASSRYLGALVTIAVGLSTLFIPTITAEIQRIGLEAANIAFGFLFGSRIVMSWKN